MLLEHIPQLRFLHSSQGVLLIIYQSGEACFFPVNDQSKTTSSAVKLLTNTQKKLKGTLVYAKRTDIGRYARRRRGAEGN